MRDRLRGTLRFLPLLPLDRFHTVLRSAGFTPAGWKMLLSLLVGLLIVQTIIMDFDDPSYPEWALFREGTLIAPHQVDNAKAAIIAMLGVGLLFIGFIPSAGYKGNTYANGLLRLIAVFATGSTGWYWLSSATDGQAGYYLLVLLPFVVLFAFPIPLFVVFTAAWKHDDRQIREEGRAKPNLKLLAVGLAVMIIVFLAVSALAYIPERFF